MKRLIILIILVSVILTCYAQNKVPAKTNGASEIDKLYEKYKNSTTIDLSTLTGNLIGLVSTNLNESGKPILVNISGDCYSRDILEDFLVNTMKMKIKQGYKIYNGNSYLLDNTIKGNIDYLLSIIEGRFIVHENMSYEMYKLIKEHEQTENAVLIMRKGNMYFRINLYNCERDKKVESYDRNTADIGYSTMTYNLKDCYSWSIETGDNNRKKSKGSTNFEF